MSWKTRAPRTRKAREALLARCGSRAFLDPDHLKYPIMAKSGACAIDCAGLRAAKSRAAQYHRPRAVAHANRLIARSSCSR